MWGKSLEHWRGVEEKCYYGPAPKHFLYYLIVSGFNNIKRSLQSLKNISQKRGLLCDLWKYEFFYMKDEFFTVFYVILREENGEKINFWAF